MNKLDNVVTNKINTNKNKLNDAIYNETTFYTSSFNLSSGTRDPSPVVTVTLLGGKKQRATIVAGIIFLWYNGATEITIEQKNT